MRVGKGNWVGLEKLTFLRVKAVGIRKMHREFLKRSALINRLDADRFMTFF